VRPAHFTLAGPVARTRLSDLPTRRAEPAYRRQQARVGAFPPVRDRAEPVILHEQPNKGRVLIEKFEPSAASTGFAVVLLTGDDLGRAKSAAKTSPRGKSERHLRDGILLRSVWS